MHSYYFYYITRLAWAGDFDSLLASASVGVAQADRRMSTDEYRIYYSAQRREEMRRPGHSLGSARQRSEVKKMKGVSTEAGVSEPPG